LYASETDKEPLKEKAMTRDPEINCRQVSDDMAKTGQDAAGDRYSNSITINSRSRKEKTAAVGNVCQQ